jgi:predicted DCC family thiol-disulfide oxidoreductase YuxK
MKIRSAHDNASRGVLIYDSSCAVCSGAVNWIQDNAIPGSFDVVPCHAVQNGVPNVGIKREDCLQAVHLVLPDGRILKGEKALPEIVARLGKYRLAGVLFKLPGAATVSRIAYRWFAIRRYRIAAMLSHMSVSRGRRRDA